MNEPFSGEPIRWSACFASVALTYGPVVIVDCVDDLLVTTNDIPRAIVLCSASSFGSVVERSRRRCQPALTSVIARAKAAGSPPSA